MNLTRLKAAACAVALSAMALVTGAGAAHAQATAGPVYVALGDSYSSGVGAGGYDDASGDCHRTSRAYPALWAGAHAAAGFSFTACSGARTGDVLNNQLGPLNAATSLVSITIGGNDAGFSDVMTICVQPGESNCLSRIAEARAFVRDILPGRLDQVYSAVTSRAPAAHVAVLGYPRFYRLSGSCTFGLTETERAAINDASDFLNSVIAQRAAAHGFAFGNVAAAFSGHEICSDDEWLHSVALPVYESYHPTAAGQSGGYLPVLESVD
ncbi:SGNH/GDSL hydrolase family protein [Streptomyces sp. B1866]|uniref:SGNH/GDSL hydrolase family protein n=1 Tax=Streptomyces sp. B1866 TaxID=3075431 RepID=UPI00288DCA5D|nr:SGNH/GDSL hydrolase family protein [Streptomyces sp. B1866]MDT3397492.1 SGNH/GDSL hydrolase family protein [Streptomyces sp. B1866]